MERFEVNQRLLDLYDSPSYLEIGVQEGLTFHRIKAAKKVAVDPTFVFDVESAQRDHRNAAYHQMPSDLYFATQRGRNEKFDVIFIDGLHTFDQTLRDLLNGISCLKPNGVVIVDDVLPSSYAASLPSFEDSIQLRQLIGDSYPAWMGDVYRLVFFIQDYLTAFDFATVVENHGQTVMWPAIRRHVEPPRTVEAIARLEYLQSVTERQAFKLRPFNEIEEAVRMAIRA